MDIAAPPWAIRAPSIASASALGNQEHVIPPCAGGVKNAAKDSRASGLVYYAYTSNGHAVPRTAQAQFEAARQIPLAEAAEGDLLFFRDQAKLSHVGIYLGDGRFVHAPSSGDTVRVANIDASYYQRHFVAAGRLLP
jgi:hypothetical protein